MLNNITHFIDTHPIGRIFRLGKKNVAWKKTAQLTAGIKIAVETDGRLDWDEIVSVKKVGRERVYDIEVEGTHNFVANGIVAHNTYISGNVGIGTTNPSEKLHVSGGNVRAKSFKDDDETGYYLDPAGTISLLTAGKVAIGTSQPTTALTLAGDGSIWITGTNASISAFRNITIDPCLGVDYASCTREVTIGDGSTKLNAGTIDPPYTINGERYATYLPGMVGIKEEVTGTVTTGEKVEGVGYRTTIHFANQPKGSDLWLFNKVTSLSTRMDKMVVLLSPAGNSRAWYAIDQNALTLSIYTSRPTTVSYRLTAPRFDDQRYQNTRASDNATTGFVINSPDPIPLSPDGDVAGAEEYMIQESVNGNGFDVKTKTNEIIHEIGAYSQAFIGSLQAGLVNTRQLVVDGTATITGALTAGSATITNSITANLITAEEISTSQLTVAGQTLRDYILRVVENARQTGELAIPFTLPSSSIERLKVKTIEPESLESSGVVVALGEKQTFSVLSKEGTPAAVFDNHGNAAISGNLAIEKDASIAGTLYADRIITAEGELTPSASSSAVVTNITNITNVTRMIATESAGLTVDLTPSVEASLSALIDSVTSQVKQFEGPAVDLTGKSLTLDALSLHDTLSVLGSAVLGDTSIAGSLYVDASVRISKNGIETIGETLYLQKTRLAALDIMNGALTVDMDGNVVLSGNLAVHGDVTVGGVLGVGTIRPITDDLVLSLEKRIATQSGERSFGSLIVKGNQGKEVASVDDSGNAAFAGDITASGSATVAKLNIALPALSISSPSAAVATPSGTIGADRLAAGATEMTIPSTQVTENSLIYVTPVSSTGNQVLYVKNKKERKSFTVGIDQPVNRTILFNWWIVN